MMQVATYNFFKKNKKMKDTDNINILNVENPNY